MMISRSLFYNHKQILINNRYITTYSIKNSKKYDNDFGHYDNRQIFQVYPPICNVNLFDVEYCLEVCSKTTYLHKKELFYSNGIDYDRVFKYHNYIKDLNKIYKMTNKTVYTFEKNINNNPFKNAWVITKIIIHWLIQK
jgi:hypothetical protein